MKNGLTDKLQFIAQLKRSEEFYDSSLLLIPMAIADNTRGIFLPVIFPLPARCSACIPARRDRSAKPPRS